MVVGDENIIEFTEDGEIPAKGIFKVEESRRELRLY